MTPSSAASDALREPKVGPSQTRTIADRLAEFAGSLTYDSIPVAVRERAKVLILDATGIAFASTTMDFAAPTLRSLQTLGAGGTDVIGMAARLSLRDGVLMNGLLVHGLDYDDTHMAGIIHATASCFPCALGVAAHAEASGRALLTAYVLGMEAAARLSMVARGGFHDRGFHPTGLIGGFACTLIAGKLLGLTARQLTLAQGIALSLTAGGSQEFLQEGAWTKRLHPGWAGAVGITSAVLAREGFIGPTRAYEGRYGVYRTYLGGAVDDQDLALATAGLGEVWEVGNVALKPFPVCHYSHACGDSMLAILREHHIRPDDVQSVLARVPAQTVHIVCEPIGIKRRPANDYDAKFSIPYLIATILVRGRFGPDELGPAARNDPAILALADRVGYEIDRDSGFPEYYSGGIVVTLKDGRHIAHHEPINRGCAQRPLDSAAVEQKFMENAGLAMSAATARAVMRSVQALDREEAASSLARGLSVVPRPGPGLGTESDPSA